MAHDPFKYFRVEAREILDQLAKSMLDLERGSAVVENVQRLLRLAHTLKGAARVVKQTEIADHAHAIEDVIAAFRDNAENIPRDGIDAVLGLVDKIGTRVAALGVPLESSAQALPVGKAPAGADGAEQRGIADETFRSVRADVEEMDALIDGVTEAHVQLASLRRALSTIDRLSHLQELLADQLRAGRGARGTEAPASKAVALAEEVTGLLGTLATNVGIGVEQVDRELRQVRDTAARLRLLPVGLMFNVLERTARDVAQNLDKRIIFQSQGGDVRLDAHVLGVIQNALVQVVRNAVAHGVETQFERKQANKPADGRVTLQVTRKNNRVSFTCSDDGQGVDVEAVRHAAQRKGLLASEGHKHGPAELIRLLLKGGITTSSAVTEVSGRGIGLDVVREAAARLGGEVNVSTETGKGMTLELLVPVSLTSLDGLLVEAGAQRAVIPLDAVRRTLRLNASDIAIAPGGASIVLDGQVIPFAPLSRALRSMARSATSRRDWSAVVVHSNGMLAALGVDRLLGKENVVLRPLPTAVPADPVIAGAALDAEGNPQLVLDPETLVALAAAAEGEQGVSVAARLPILVVDDSLTTRMLEQSILESAGYEVDLASSGEEGMQKARQRRYALCLVDVEMPGMDGFEFIRRIRADANLRDIPAILVTSRNAPEDRQRGEDVGAQAYIVKSEFDQTQLIDRISKLVGDR